MIYLQIKKIQLKNVNVKRVEVKLDFPLHDDDYNKSNNYNNYCVFHT